MKKPVLPFLIALVLLLTIALPAFAADGQPPVGSCPPGFVLHEFGHHDGDHDHHIGITTDLNGDGLICVKHLDNGLHVHVDNVIP
jgi:hypothetical protein